jgi:hypothetical protein
MLLGTVGPFAIAIPIIGADCQYEAACFTYIAIGLDSRR